MRPWRALAIHYGTAERPPADLTLDTHDPHERPQRIDYFIWVVRHENRLVLIDTGFSPAEGRARGRTLLIHPVDALRCLSIAPGDITDVVITHLHYDHAGNLGDFPNARFHIQDREMAYGTGRCMCHERMRRPFAAEAVVDAVRLVYSNRMCFHDGDEDVVPGLSLHLVGGHSKGLQVVRVAVGNRIAVIASDALHFERYLQSDDVFPLFANYEAVVEGYRKLQMLAGENGIIVPGHDPEVLVRFPPLAPDLPFIRVLL
ncbi:N-acyl homoserine lactonase family protein [Rhizobium sp. A37_96]